MQAQLNGHRQGGQNDTRGYTPLPGGTPARRYCHFLDWAATKHPGVFWLPNMVIKAAMGFSKMPRLESDEVALFERRRYGMGGALFKLYKRMLVARRSLGLRATFSDADALVNILPRRSGRLESARASFVRTAEAIDPDRVPNTPELKPFKDWRARAVGDLLRQLKAPEFATKLLPPVVVREAGAQPMAERSESRAAVKVAS